MRTTKIEWTDHTLNPIKGKCKTGCGYCYANRMYDRFKWNPNVRLRLDVFNELKTLKKASRIFLCSTHEMFGDWIDDFWISQIILIMHHYPQHSFQILTKCPERASTFYFPENVWLGTTITRQKEASNMQFLKVHFRKRNPDNIKFVSFEPLHSRIHYDLKGIDWVIIGAETGNRRGKIVPEKEWIEDLIFYAKEENIPVFLKDNLKPFWDGGWFRELPTVIK